ncbi:MAG TPA: hypothetical protein PKY59_10400 [Pyrinomonadaceae bacterium]|nr:hypothetical protein [Pyrinomonadaceae bacterium]
MKRFLFVSFLFLGIVFAANFETKAQTVKRVQFAKGATSSTIKGTITGYKYIDYKIGIKAGQVLSLDLSPQNKLEMVIFMPDGDNMPDAAGIGGGTMQIDESGDYTVRVLMPRSAARRKNVTANFTLKIEIKDMQ